MRTGKLPSIFRQPPPSLRYKPDMFGGGDSLLQGMEAELRNMLLWYKLR